MRKTKFKIFWDDFLNWCNKSPKSSIAKGSKSKHHKCGCGKNKCNS